MEITRHFTASTFVVFENKVLLHFHKKLNLWLPLGGHIDRDELPEEAAIREVKEESGLDVELYNFTNPLGLKDVRELISPMRVLLEDINPYHQHIDFVYAGKSKTNNVIASQGESNQFKWLNLDQLNELEMPDNISELAKVALDLLR